MKWLVGFLLLLALGAIDGLPEILDGSNFQDGDIDSQYIKTIETFEKPQEYGNVVNNANENYGSDSGNFGIHSGYLGSELGINSEIVGGSGDYTGNHGADIAENGIRLPAINIGQHTPEIGSEVTNSGMHNGIYARGADTAHLLTGNRNQNNGDYNINGVFNHGLTAQHLTVTGNQEIYSGNYENGIGRQFSAINQDISTGKYINGVFNQGLSTPQFTIEARNPGINSGILNHGVNTDQFVATDQVTNIGEYVNGGVNHGLNTVQHLGGIGNPKTHSGILNHGTHTNQFVGQNFNTGLFNQRLNTAHHISGIGSQGSHSGIPIHGINSGQFVATDQVTNTGEYVNGMLNHGLNTMQHINRIGNLGIQTGFGNPGINSGILTHDLNTDQFVSSQNLNTGHFNQGLLNTAQRISGIGNQEIHSGNYINGILNHPTNTRQLGPGNGHQVINPAVYYNRILNPNTAQHLSGTENFGFNPGYVNGNPVSKNGHFVNGNADGIITHANVAALETKYPRFVTNIYRTEPLPSVPMPNVGAYRSHNDIKYYNTATGADYSVPFQQRINPVYYGNNYVNRPLHKNNEGAPGYIISPRNDYNGSDFASNIVKVHGIHPHGIVSESNVHGLGSHSNIGNEYYRYGEYGTGQGSYIPNKEPTTIIGRSVNIPHIPILGDGILDGIIKSTASANTGKVDAKINNGIDKNLIKSNKDVIAIKLYDILASKYGDESTNGISIGFDNDKLEALISKYLTSKTNANLTIGINENDNTLALISHYLTLKNAGGTGSTGANHDGTEKAKILSLITRYLTSRTIKEKDDLAAELYILLISKYSDASESDETIKSFDKTKLAALIYKYLSFKNDSTNTKETGKGKYDNSLSIDKQAGDADKISTLITKYLASKGENRDEFSAKLYKLLSAEYDIKSSDGNSTFDKKTLEALITKYLYSKKIKDSEQEGGSNDTDKINSNDKNNIRTLIIKYLASKNSNGQFDEDLAVNLYKLLSIEYDIKLTDGDSKFNKEKLDDLITKYLLNSKTFNHNEQDEDEVADKTDDSSDKNKITTIITKYLSSNGRNKDDLSAKLFKLLTAEYDIKSKDYDSTVDKDLLESLISKFFTSKKIDIGKITEGNDNDRKKVDISHINTIISLITKYLASKNSNGEYDEVLAIKLYKLLKVEYGIKITDDDNTFNKEKLEELISKFIYFNNFDSTEQTDGDDVADKTDDSSDKNQISTLIIKYLVSKGRNKDDFAAKLYKLLTAEYDNKSKDYDSTVDKDLLESLISKFLNSKKIDNIKITDENDNDKKEDEMSHKNTISTLIRKYLASKNSNGKYDEDLAAKLYKLLSVEYGIKITDGDNTFDKAKLEALISKYVYSKNFDRTELTDGDDNANKTDDNSNKNNISTLITEYMASNEENKNNLALKLYKLLTAEYGIKSSDDNSTFSKEKVEALISKYLYSRNIDDSKLENGSVRNATDEINNTHKNDISTLITKYLTSYGLINDDLATKLHKLLSSEFGYQSSSDDSTFDKDQLKDLISKYLHFKKVKENYNDDKKIEVKEDAISHENTISTLITKYLASNEKNKDDYAAQLYKLLDSGNNTLADNDSAFNRTTLESLISKYLHSKKTLDIEIQIAKDNTTNPKSNEDKSDKNRPIDIKQQDNDKKIKKSSDENGILTLINKYWSSINSNGKNKKDIASKLYELLVSKYGNKAEDNSFDESKLTDLISKYLSFKKSGVHKVRGKHLIKIDDTYNKNKISASISKYLASKHLSERKKHKTITKLYKYLNYKYGNTSTGESSDTLNNDKLAGYISKYLNTRNSELDENKDKKNNANDNKILRLIAKIGIQISNMPQKKTNAVANKDKTTKVTSKIDYDTESTDMNDVTEYTAEKTNSTKINKTEVSFNIENKDTYKKNNSGTVNDRTHNSKITETEDKDSQTEAKGQLSESSNETITSSLIDKIMNSKKNNRLKCIKHKKNGDNKRKRSSKNVKNKTSEMGNKDSKSESATNLNINQEVKEKEFKDSQKHTFVSQNQSRANYSKNETVINKDTNSTTNLKYNVTHVRSNNENKNTEVPKSKSANVSTYSIEKDVKIDISKNRSTVINLSEHEFHNKSSKNVTKTLSTANQATNVKNVSNNNKNEDKYSVKTNKNSKSESANDLTLNIDTKAKVNKTPKVRILKNTICSENQNNTDTLNKNISINNTRIMTEEETSKKTKFVITIKKNKNKSILTENASSEDTNETNKIGNNNKTANDKKGCNYYKIVKFNNKHSAHSQKVTDKSKRLGFNNSFNNDLITNKKSNSLTSNISNEISGNSTIVSDKTKETTIQTKDHLSNSDNTNDNSKEISNKTINNSDKNNDNSSTKIDYLPPNTGNQNYNLTHNDESVIKSNDSSLTNINDDSFKRYNDNSYISTHYSNESNGSSSSNRYKGDTYTINDDFNTSNDNSSSDTNNDDSYTNNDNYFAYNENIDTGEDTNSDITIDDSSNNINNDNSYTNDDNASDDTINDETDDNLYASEEYSSKNPERIKTNFEIYELRKDSSEIVDLESLDGSDVNEGFIETNKESKYASNIGNNDENNQKEHGNNVFKNLDEIGTEEIENSNQKEKIIDISRKIKKRNGNKEKIRRHRNKKHNSKKHVIDEESN